jgi:hypothetical protein
MAYTVPSTPITVGVSASPIPEVRVFLCVNVLTSYPDYFRPGFFTLSLTRSGYFPVTV